MSSELLVLDAVAADKITTKSGLLQRLFAYWFDAFVYNQIWEDPRVDLKALEINSDSRILSISSGGCNVMNYLIAEPGSITTVDLNRYHIYLTRLKIAAAASLPNYEAFYRFFGEGKHPDNIVQYEKKIRPLLNAETQKFWECSGLFTGRRIEFFSKGGLYDHSRNGYFLKFFHAFAHFVSLRPEAILEAKSRTEQEMFFEKHIAPFFDTWFVRLIGRLPITMFGLGIPPQQLDELKQDSDGRSLVDIYRERVHRLACDFPIEENYFAWQALARRYDDNGRRAIPDYLKPENFDRLKENVYRVSTNIGSVTEEIRSKPWGSFNRFVFLDAQDWMNAATVTELWTQIAEKGEPGSRIIFRTASETSPIERKLPSELRKHFEYKDKRSRKLFAEDRSSIYGGFHLYILKR